MIRRKPRPLVRETGTLRDTRLFLVACDDRYAPKQYLEFFRFSRVKVHVVETSDGTSAANHVLDRLLAIEAEEDDERWMLLDTDHCTQGTHQRGFVDALRRARQKGVKGALSSPCFESWLLLHHDEASPEPGFANCTDGTEALRAKLGRYDKTKLVQSDYPLHLVSDACARAERMDARASGDDGIPIGNATRVYKLWQAIVRTVLPSQLPKELQGLLRG